VFGFEETQGHSGLDMVPRNPGTSRIPSLASRKLLLYHSHFLDNNDADEVVIFVPTFRFENERALLEISYFFSCSPSSVLAFSCWSGGSVFSPPSPRRDSASYGALVGLRGGKGAVRIFDRGVLKW
jgi:hypothetical protein